MMTSAAIKRLGVLLIVIGAPLAHYVLPKPFWLRTSAAIAAGLMMIFFSKEHIEDERVRDLKFKALHAAFSVSFTLTLIINWVMNRDFDVTRDFDSRLGAWRSISAFDLIILTMICALALFHYWRLQDAAATPATGFAEGGTHRELRHDQEDSGSGISSHHARGIDAAERH